MVEWADGSLDILSFSVDIPSKPEGDHRIYVLLTNPRGGAVLHHGEDTVAYGIIDDDTISPTNAIFIDADAEANGIGTQESPYNNWYSARDAVLITTRFIYIKGLITPDNTDATPSVSAVNYFRMKATFGGRTSEAQRLVIRNWPSFSGGIDGDGQTSCTGFFCDGTADDTSSVKYITFRKLSGRNLNNADGDASSGKSYFIRTRGSSSDYVGYFTAEIIDIDGIVSGANAANAVWYSQDCSNLKLWRWSVANTGFSTKADNLNSFECYRTDNVSIQRCTIERTAGGIYQKEGFTGHTKVGMSLRFNHFKGCQIRISTQGDRAIQDYHIIQNNIIDEVQHSFSSMSIRFDMVDNGSVATKQHISNNIFYNYGFSTFADITISDNGFEGVILYNNIHYKSKRPWKFDLNVSTPEYLDFNHYEYDGITAPVFVYLTQASDLSLELVRESTPFTSNASTGDPEFNPASWQLAPSSPCYQKGVGGSNKGVYLLGTEKIGSGNLIGPALPEKMAPPQISVRDNIS